MGRPSVTPAPSGLLPRVSGLAQLLLPPGPRLTLDVISFSKFLPGMLAHFQDYTSHTFTLLVLLTGLKLTKKKTTRKSEGTGVRRGLH